MKPVIERLGSGGMRDVTLHRLYASEPIGDLSSSFPGEFVKENTIFWPIEKNVWVDF